MFDEVLRDVLARVEGARCVLLAARDGMIVAAAMAEPGPAPEAIAASLADMFRKVASAHAEAGLDAPTEFTSGGAGDQAVVRAVTPQYLLIAVLERGPQLGRARFELRKAAAAVQPELI